MARNNYELWRERYGLEQVRRLAEDGLSEEAIASALGLELTTMRLWLKKYPDFAAAIRLGSAESDYVVINALYKKATGHSVPLKKGASSPATSWSSEMSARRALPVCRKWQCWY